MLFLVASNKIAYWELIDASQMVFKSIIRHDYYLLLMEDPACVIFKHPLGAINNQDFVETAIMDLSRGGEVPNKNFGGGVPLVLQKPDSVLN